MWLEIKTGLRWVVGVEGENRNKLGACQKKTISFRLNWLYNIILYIPGDFADPGER